MSTEDGNTFRFKGYRCNKVGYKALNCAEKSINNKIFTSNEEAYNESYVLSFVVFSGTAIVKKTSKECPSPSWILDSECTTHLYNH